METVDSFALKLSMRLKAPVPRMRQLVARAPCTVAQRLPYKKARWLHKVIGELGGTARLEGLSDTAPVEERPVHRLRRRNSRSRPSAARPRAVFCARAAAGRKNRTRASVRCLQHFNKTDKINVPNFVSRPGFDDPGENPLFRERRRKSSTNRGLRSP